MSQLRQPGDYLKNNSHVHSGKDKNSKQTLNTQFFPSYERRQLSLNHGSGQLSSSYEREQLETATRRVETRTQKTTHIPKRKQRTFENTQKGMSTENNVGVQTRAMAQRVDNKANPGTRAEENRPCHSSYNRTA